MNKRKAQKGAERQKKKRLYKGSNKVLRNKFLQP